jgi:hypothetical protein
MGDIIEFIGWIAALGMFCAFSNYALKLIGRKYLKLIPKKYDTAVVRYRSLMKFMVQKHRYFGFATVVFLMAHGLAVILLSTVSITGIIAAGVVIMTVSLGAYGFYYKKNIRSNLFTVHRVLGFIVLIAVMVHLSFKTVVSL